MGGLHPYKFAPDRAFWSRAVATGWDAARLVDGTDYLIHKGDKVVSAGSCFAANIIPYIERAGLTYLRTEETHPAFRHLEPEALGYANFSAAYGNIYTARQLLQLLKRCLYLFSPEEDRWHIGDEVVDPFRPGLRYRAGSDREFDLLTAQHLRKTHEAFAKADVFVFTLGLTEAWISRRDGAVFPACPGTVAGSFDPQRHEFYNFGVAEVFADLDEFLMLLGGINPHVRLILTVSPVPLVATATGNHVLNATMYSKSVLRVAAEQIVRKYPFATYFPAYELVAGPQAPSEFYQADKRNVSPAGVEAVMAALLERCEVDRRPAQALQLALPGGSAMSLREISRAIVERECEEALADPSNRPAA